MALRPLVVRARPAIAGLWVAPRRTVATTWYKQPISALVSPARTSVDEKLVNVTFVNYAGQRTSLPGLVGDTLLDVAQRYNYAFVDGACGGGGNPSEELHREGNWYEPQYGEGAFCHFCHVIIPESHYALLPPKMEDEVENLQSYPFPEDMTHTSRLACQVKLTKELDGIVVYVPDGPPSDIP